MKYKLKDSIQSFISYKPNTESYIIKLDANESRVNETLLKHKLDLTTVNLYPDNYAIKLRKKIASYQQVSFEEVMVGAGSSELLELVVKTFVNPLDYVLSVEPSFVMYKKYTMLSNGQYETVPAKNNYETVVDDLITKAKEINPKIIFLCTPNNPTGFMLSQQDVIKVLENVDSLVVVDEAYMEFAYTNETVIGCINKYPNLIVNRTFSKAFAIAGARLGYFIANKDLIDTLFTAKTPYSVNGLTQELGVISLSNLGYLNDNVTSVLVQKATLSAELEALGIICYESEGNFLYVEFKAFDIAEKLKEKRILIRSFGNGYYRITVGSNIENIRLVNGLKEVLYETGNN